MTTEIIGDKKLAPAPLDHELINKVLPAKDSSKCATDIIKFHRHYYNYTHDKTNTGVEPEFGIAEFDEIPCAIAYRPSRWYNWGNKILDSKLLHSCKDIGKTEIINEFKRTTLAQRRITLTDIGKFRAIEYLNGGDSIIYDVDDLLHIKFNYKIH